MSNSTVDAALGIAQKFAVAVRGIPNVLGVVVCEEDEASLLVITLRQPGDEESEDAIYHEQINIIRRHPHCPIDFSVRTISEAVRTPEDLIPYLPMRHLLLCLNPETDAYSPAA